MSESQNIEWKRNWHDDYLKWICGFANAVGGTIYIGKDDDGAVTHLGYYKALMESVKVWGDYQQFNMHDEVGINQKLEELKELLLGRIARIQKKLTNQNRKLKLWMKILQK